MSERVVAMGDMLVEIMRKRVGVDFKTAGDFVGPYPSGAPVIFAGALARLGVDTTFYGSVGADDFGDVIVERLRDDGVNTEGVRVLGDETTGVAFVTYFGDGSRRFIYHADKAATGRVEEGQIEPDRLERFDHFHVVGTSLSLNERWRKITHRAARVVKDNGGTISFDPNLRPEMIELESLRSVCYSILEMTDVFLPGEDEITLFGEDEDPETVARQWLDRGVGVVAVKRGDRGCRVMDGEQRFVAEPFPVEEVDPTGAGDCFSAGFLKGVLSGWDLRRTARFANAVGALAVTEKGPMEGVFDLGEVEDFIQRRGGK